MSELVIGIALNHRKAEELRQYKADSPISGDFTEALILIPPDTLRKASQPLMTALSGAVELAYEKGYLRNPVMRELVLRTGSELKDISAEYLKDANRIGRAWDGFACIVKMGGCESASLFTLIDYAPEENSEKVMYVRLGIIEDRKRCEGEVEEVVKFWFPALVPTDFHGLVMSIEEEREITNSMSIHIRKRIEQILESTLGVATNTSGWELKMRIDPSKIRPVYLDQQSCIAFLSGTKDTGFIYIYADRNEKSAGLIQSPLDIQEGYLVTNRYIRFWDILNAIHNYQPDQPDGIDTFRISPFDFHIPRNGNGHR